MKKTLTFAILAASLVAAAPAAQAATTPATAAQIGDSAPVANIATIGAVGLGKAGAAAAKVQRAGPKAAAPRRSETSAPLRAERADPYAPVYRGVL